MKFKETVIKYMLDNKLFKPSIVRPYIYIYIFQRHKLPLFGKIAKFPSSIYNLKTLFALIIFHPQIF